MVIEEQAARQVDPTDEAVLIRIGLPVLRNTAFRMWHRLGNHIELDELISIGLGTLIRAVRTFDPDKARFVPYIVQRLNWSMLSAARNRARRRLDPCRGVPLGAATRFADHYARPIKNSINGDDGSTSSILEFRGSPNTAGVVRAAGDLVDMAMSTDMSPEEETLRNELAAIIRGALEAISPKHRALLERHYFDGNALKALADELGISKTAASRQHRSAVRELADELRRRGIDKE